jgi:hypothetical protein
MYVRFPSLGRSAEFGYAIQTDISARSSSRATGRPLADWAFEYQTYGDGLTIHSDPYRVQVTHIADFCASLAAFLLAPRDPEEHDRIFDGLSYTWPRPLERRDLTFAYSVRFDSKKPYRYYSMRERKVSSAESKQYDKRWERIPEQADGTLAGVLRILSPESWLMPGRFTLLDTYRRALDVYRYITFEIEGGWSKRPEELLEIDREAESPFDAVSEILDAWQGLARASRIVTNHLERLRRDSAAAVEESA